jgi:hypothetical protein
VNTAILVKEIRGIIMPRFDNCISFIFNLTSTIGFLIPRGHFQDTGAAIEDNLEFIWETSDYRL